MSIRENVNKSLAAVGLPLNMSNLPNNPIGSRITRTKESSSSAASSAASAAAATAISSVSSSGNVLAKASTDAKSLLPKSGSFSSKVSSSNNSNNSKRRNAPITVAGKNNNKSNNNRTKAAEVSAAAEAAKAKEVADELAKEANNAKAEALAKAANNAKIEAANNEQQIDNTLKAVVAAVEPPTQDSVQITVMGKIKEIFYANNTVSNIIKLCISIIVILLILISINIIYKTENELQNALVYLLFSILSVLIGEVLFNKVIGGTIGSVVSVFFAGAATLFFLLFLQHLITYFSNMKINSPWILQGNKSARNSMIIPQDPENPETVILYRSDNQEDGIEFSYTFWMLIENYNYKVDEWKHVLHKGAENVSPEKNSIMCPGVWLHPIKNTMRIYLNTMEDMNEYIDIENMPLKKWVNVAIVIKQKILEIYINGRLKVKQTLSSIPRQNFGDLWINLYGGFDGYMSQIRYHRKALEYYDVDKLINDGPASSSCIDSDAMPPYLDDDWWLSRN